MIESNSGDLAEIGFSRGFVAVVSEGIVGKMSDKMKQSGKTG